MGRFRKETGHVALHHYQCEFCGGYHIGHARTLGATKKERRELRRLRFKLVRTLQSLLASRKEDHV